MKVPNEVVENAAFEFFNKVCNGEKFACEHCALGGSWGCYLERLSGLKEKLFWKFLEDDEIIVVYDEVWNFKFFSPSEDSLESVLNDYLEELDGDVDIEAWWFDEDRELNHVSSVKGYLREKGWVD